MQLLNDSITMSFKEKLSLISPITWPAWLGMGCLWLITRLPIRWQFSIGRAIGKLIYRYSPKLRTISTTNVDLCFPELSDVERTQLIKKNFEALGIGVIEAAMAWWMSDRRLKKCAVTLNGVEHAEKAFSNGKGVILLGPHFICLEMVGRMLGSQYSFAVMYRPHKKKLIAFIQESFRKKYQIKTIARHRMRELLNTLESNMAVWYAYDIDGGEKRSVFVPFFGVQTASLTAISRIAKLSGATIVPIDFYRTDDKWGYEINLSAPLENFPSDDVVQDATRLNQFLEQAIRNKPEQYIWQYKRFKTRPAGEKRFY